MSIISRVSENLILPVSDLLTGRSIAQQRRFLDRSQWWTSQHLRDYQDERLRMLIRHAWTNVPFWRDVMKQRKLTPDDIRTQDDLPKLPVLTKETYKNNFPKRMIAGNLSKRVFYKGHSSGSTGRPIQYLISRDAYGMNKACNLRGWDWMGFRLGDKIVKVSQNKRSKLEKRVQDFVNRTLIFFQDYSPESLQRFVRDMQAFRPDFLRSYPDPLMFLAQHLKRENIRIPSPKAINTTGNILFPEVRELAEEVFQAPVFDSYSCEGGPNAFECPTHECYHLSMEYGIAEIVGEDGAPVGPGEKGRLLTTDLWNFAAPFIRYDSRDIVVRSDSECSCGRKLLPLKQIIGRDNDILITPQGTFLIAQTFTTYFKYIPQIQQFQVEQDQPDHLIFRLQTTEDFHISLSDKIIEDWSKRLNGTMKIDIEILDEIPRLSSGKLRFLIRNKDIKLGW